MPASFGDPASPDFSHEEKEGLHTPSSRGGQSAEWLLLTTVIGSRVAM